MCSHALRRCRRLLAPLLLGALPCLALPAKATSGNVSPPRPDVLPDRVVAVVNDDIITLSDAREEAWAVTGRAELLFATDAQALTPRFKPSSIAACSSRPPTK